MAIKHKIYAYISLLAMLALCSSFAFAYEPITCTIDVVGHGTYTITNTDNASDSRSITIDGKGDFTCSFSSPGNYMYCIESMQENEDEIYQVSCSIFDDGDALEINTAIKRMSDEAKVDAVDYIGYTDNIPVYSSVVNGADSASAIQFKLVPQSATSPMPSDSTNGQKTVQTDGNGSVDFGDLHFTTPGVYDYTVTVVDDGNNDFEYDDSTYTVRIMVTRQDGVLTSTKEFYKDGQLLSNASHIEITNTYVGGNHEGDDEAEYYFDSGSDKTWTKNSADSFDITVHRTADDASTFGHFEKFYIDNVLVSAENYAAVSGSLKAGFKSSYMETLSTGVHTLKAKFDDGTATHPFTIADKQSDSGGNEGNSNNGNNGNNASGNSNANGNSSMRTNSTDSNGTTASSQVHGKTGDSYSIFKYAILLIFGILSFGVLLIANKGSERESKKRNS